MDYVEREFQAVFKGHSFMTAACLRLRPGDGRVTFCGAGQPPLLIARGSGRVDHLRSARPPLGLNTVGESIEESCDLDAGEGVLLYTDGLYEMYNASGKRLGHDALARLLPSLDHQSAEEWLGNIIEKTKAYAGEASFPDDIAAFAALHEDQESGGSRIRQ